MTFQDLNLKSEYDSITDDVYTEFFNKVLKSSKQCSRVGGKFTSRNFAACAEGLQEFIQNDGVMRLVLIPEFSTEDIDSINKGITDAQSILSECWIKDFSEIQEKFVVDHVKALAWMLANNNLEIKIVVPVRQDGSVISHVELKNSQIFKRKTGIFWDTNNQSVSFSGDIDFDDKILGEYYHFRVYRGWDESEIKYLNNDLEEFHRYWDGEQIQNDIILKTMSLPEAVRANLIKIAPKSKSEITLQNLPRLRPYQKEAINNWLENDQRGIFEMATGTGKTFTAIGCLDEIKENNEKLLVVIACPFDNIERQWQLELLKWGFDSTITSGNPKWDQNMKDEIASLELDDFSNLLIKITTYKTFCTEKFLKIIENADIPTLLIADEVHNAGSSNYIYGLTNAYNYRLGLSATLERYFDPDGTMTLQKFFGDTVYTMTLKDAIEKGFLVGYYYHPRYVDLNDKEYKKYAVLTKVIAQLWNSKKITDRENLKNALRKRSKIIRDAESKLTEFKKWTKEHTIDTKYLLAYCSENQMIEVKNTLNREGVTNREITAKNPKNPIDRIKIIKNFSSGLYDAIVANRILDEGVDIPSAKNCIMLASTGNPKQFVQRRGRVLRKFNQKYKDGTKKDYARIYDILVIPDISPDYTEDEMRLERQIVASQIKRQEEMAKIALNHESCLKDIEELKKKFLLD